METVSQIPEHQEAGDEETEVTDAVGDEGFLGGIGIRPRRSRERIHLIPEADQQEGAKPHAFPADEEHHVRVAADEDHHGRDEQIEENKEARKASFFMLEAHILVHVSDGVDVDKRANARDNQHHRGRERVNAEGPIDLECADMDPLRERNTHPFRG